MPAAADVRAVLASCPEFDVTTCGLGTFVTLMFRNPQFAGRGDFLLCWLRVPITRDGFERLIAQLYPDAAADRIFGDTGAPRRRLVRGGPRELAARDSQTLLDDLLAAADRHATRTAFELRLAELRAGTAKFRRFWQRWDALHPPGAALASPT